MTIIVATPAPDNLTTLRATLDALLDEIAALSAANDDGSATEAIEHRYYKAYYIASRIDLMQDTP